MSTDTEIDQQELAELKKKLEHISMWAKELLETSRPENDPLKETRYICASCFLEGLLEKKEEV